MTATLDAINQIFAHVGLPPVASAATQNKQVAIVNDSLDRARKRIIRTSWPVFARRVTLTPDGLGEIRVGGYLRVIFPGHLKSRVNIRNGVVWDIREDSPYAEEIDSAFVVEDTPLEQISSDAWREYIALDAATEFAKRLNDVDANYGEIYRLRGMARKRAVNESRAIIDGMYDLGRAMGGFYS